MNNICTDAYLEQNENNPVRTETPAKHAHLIVKKSCNEICRHQAPPSGSSKRFLIGWTFRISWDSLDAKIL